MDAVLPENANILPIEEMKSLSIGNTLSSVQSVQSVQPPTQHVPCMPQNYLLRVLARHNGGGHISDTTVTENIPMQTEITLWCNNKHTWKTMIYKVEEWCSICALLKQMHRFDPNIQCVNSEYQCGQTSFEFICSSEHRFIANERNCKKGCRTCAVLNAARKKHNVTYALTLDCKCLYAHEESRLRFHCNKLRHNPHCENPGCVEIRNGEIASDREFAPGCKNFVPCNQDFYATPKQLKYSIEIFSCKNNHRWSDRVEVISTVRLFELQFDARFDDEVRREGVEFTGYNRELRIAFTHGKDRVPNKCVVNARKWCDANDVRFVYVSGGTTRTSSIAMEIAKQLFVFGDILERPVQTTVTLLRTKMHDMDHKHKLFEDRCVYCLHSPDAPK